VNHFEASSDGFNHFITVLLEELLDGVVAGNNELLICQCNCGALDLSPAAPFVCPDLEIVVQAIIVKVIKNDNLLALVAIPPFVLSLDVNVVRVIILSSGKRCLACPRWPP